MSSSSSLNHQEIFIGINVGQHDSSTCVLYKENDLFDFELIEEERLTKKKRIGFYPYLSVNEIQKKYNIESVPKSHISFGSFLMSVEDSIEFSKNSYNKKFSYVVTPEKKLTIENQESQRFTHHESHLFSTLPFLPEDEDFFILVADGIGSNKSDVEKYSLFKQNSDCDEKYCESISVYKWKKSEVTQVLKLIQPIYLDPKKIGSISPATYYTACSQVIFNNEFDSGKVMGLAPYFDGKPLDETEMMKFLNTNDRNQKVSKAEFDSLPKEDFEKFSLWASSVQNFYESYMFDLIDKIIESDKDIKNFAIAGGCALNCVFNEKLRRKNIFNKIFIPAWPNDEGISLGLTVANFYKKNDKLPLFKEKINPFKGQRLKHQEEKIKNTFKKYKIKKFSHSDLVELLKKEEILAIFQKTSECGPRALGHRSIICVPSIKGIKSYLNNNIKFRESFRPYGCSTLLEDQGQYFEEADNLYSPYMSFAPKVKDDQKEYLKEVIHQDGSIRIQSVDSNFPFLYELLKALKKETGHSIIIHTSLNINKQPILEDLNDALKFFDQSKINFMVVEDFLISRNS